MAFRNAIFWFTLIAAVLCLQAVVTAEVTDSGTEATATTDVVGSSPTPQDEQSTELRTTPEDFYTAVESADGEDEEDSLSSHPLARILTERPQHCSSTKHCKNHFKKPGCCKKKCVNLATDNKNCGMCGKCCDTKKGHRCMSGKCAMHHKTPQCTRHKKCKSGFMCKRSKCVKVVHPQSCKSDKHCKSRFVCRYGKCVKKPHPPAAQCGAHKKCSNGHTCCKGKCVDLKNNPGHCGKCDKGCGYGSRCCHGKCMNVKHDVRNCGACGKRCGFGRVCCHGYCKNIHGSDNHHCGACGKKCHTQCMFGMCGYGN